MGRPWPVTSTLKDECGAGPPAKAGPIAARAITTRPAIFLKRFDEMKDQRVFTISFIIFVSLQRQFLRGAGSVEENNAERLEEVLNGLMGCSAAAERRYDNCWKA